MSSRYSRHISLPGFGAEGQSRLNHAHVVVIGAGALGSIAASYLAAAGVGHLTICDFDTIDISNLQRQLCYAEAQVGCSKAETLGSYLRERNSEIEVTVFNGLVRLKDAESLFADCDFVVEGSDNPATKYMVSEVCDKLQRAYCIAGVNQYSGQVMTHVPGTAQYSDIFPQGSIDCGFTPCSVPGVLGPLPGIVGSIQASEALKVLTGCGKPLTNSLLTIDIEHNRWQTIEVMNN